MTGRPATAALLAYVRGTDEDDLSDYLSRMKLLWEWDYAGFVELLWFNSGPLPSGYAARTDPSGLPA